jgi:hypothetical protein
MDEHTEDISFVKWVWYKKPSYYEGFLLSLSLIYVKQNL